MQEKISLTYEVKGAREFTQAAKDSEIALRRQVKSLNETSLALQKEVIALKSATAPNKDLIAAKQKLLQQNKLLTAEVKHQIMNLKLEELAAKKAAAGMNTLGAAGKGLSVTMGQLLKPLIAVFAVFEAANIIKTADAFNQLQAKVKNSLSDVSQFDSVFQKLVESSNRSGQSIDGVAQAFVRLRPAAENLGVTNDQLIQFNETFSKMGALAGATTVEVKNSMIQLSQAIASNRLSGDELRSILEQMPQVARTIADSMGIPFEKFKQAAHDGKITADQVFKAIINKSAEVDAAFAKLPQSVERSLNQLGNSFTLLIGALNKATGATDGISKAISGMAVEVQRLTPGIVAVASEVLRFTGLVIEASRALVVAAADVFGFGDSLRALLGIDALSYLFNLAGGMDNFTTSMQLAIIEMSRFKSHVIDAVTHPLSSDVDSAERNSAVDMIADSAKQTAEMAHRAREAQRVRSYQNAISAQVRGKSSAGHIRSLPVEGKKKKGKSDAQIDRERIQDVTRSFQHQIEQAEARAGLEISRMGPFPKQENVLQKQLLAEQNTAALLNRELLKLQNTSVKTADGQRALKEASEKVKDEIVKQEKAVQEAKNALEKYQKEQKFEDFKRNEEYKTATIEYTKEQAIKAEEEQADAEQQSYQNRLLTINEYYDRLETHIQNKMQREQEAHDEAIALLEKEIDKRKELLGEDETSPGVKDLRKQQLLADLGFEGNMADLAAQSTQAKRQRKQDLTQAARDFGQDLESSISEALKDAFTGNNPLNVIKNFAKRLYSAVADSLARAIAEGLARTPFFQTITNMVGNAFNRVSGRAGGSGTSVMPGAPGQGLTISKGKAAGAAAGLAIAAGGTQLAGRSQGTLGQAGGVAMGAAGGALAGAMIGSVIPGIGTAIGAGVGALVGGTAAVGATQRGKGFFGKNKSAILGSMIGGLLGVPGIIGGFFLGKGMDKRRNDALERKRYQQEELAPFLNRVVSGADANNLEDLMARRLQAARGMQARGSDGMKMKREAVAEIDKLIKERKKVIDEFIKEIKRQNEILADEIRLADAKPFERAAIEREMAIKQIEFDTKRLLEQYKDSETAKTEILKQESLKRQQLMQQETEDFKAKTQALRDLLIERDDIANANVFQRLRSPERVKADRLTDLDRQIAESVLELKGMQSAGIGGDSLGSNQILGGIGQFMQNNQLQVIVNTTNDPNQTEQAITRAFESFARKIYGANVA